MPLDSTGGDRPRSLNVLGRALEPCSLDPLTGYHRDGCCSTGPADLGSHTVCAVVTAEFLAFSRSHGNDLSTPMPQFGFPGLRPGDRWCLCAPRWQEAFLAGVAPRVVLAATEMRALGSCELDDLRRHAIAGEE
nr:DUF2237 domain-containing protein [uncultured Lichenicoccus sp.]